MKLNVADAEHPDLNLSLGVTDEREKEIYLYLDTLKNEATFAQRLAEIAAYCQTLEEYTLAVVTTVKFLLATGQDTIVFKKH